MEHDETTVHPLTKDDVQAIRTADQWVSFHHNTERFADTDTATSVVRLSKTVDKNVAPGFQTETDVVAHREIRIHQHGNPRQGYLSIGYPDYSEIWRTIRSLIRPGDELLIQWCADEHTNAYLRDAGLHADVAKLVIIRGPKQQRLTFLLDSQVCMHNSARMIQPKTPQPVETA